MGLYKRNKIWWYKFQFDGRQYRGTTRTTDERLAGQIEAEEKRKMIADLRGFDIPATLEPMRDRIREFDGFRIDPCVYFLCDNASVVYVGQTTCLAGRVQAHLADGIKRFDRIFWFPVIDEDLDATELALIAALAPRYNVTKPKRITIQHGRILSGLGMSDELGGDCGNIAK